jgi:hypothetical protein
MEIAVLLLLVFFLLSSCMVVFRRGRSESREELIGRIALVAITGVAVYLRYEALDAGMPSCVHFRHQDQLIIAGLRATTVPCVAAAVLLVGGRWHHALTTAALFAVHPISMSVTGSELWEYFLAPGLVGALLFRRERQWRQAILGVTGLLLAITLLLVGVGSPGEELLRLALWFVPFLALLLPGRGAGRSLVIGRSVGAAIAVSALVLATVQYERDFARLRTMRLPRMLQPARDL